MNQLNPLIELQPWRDALRRARWRALLLMTGSGEVARAHIERWQAYAGAEVLWLSEQAPSGAWCMPPDKANHELGREADAVVVDLSAGLAVDAIAALAGVVRAGGWLIVVAPPLQQWPEFDDPQYSRITVEPYGRAGVRRQFLARAARMFAADSRIVHVDESFFVPEEWPACPVAPPMESDDWGCCSAQQRQVVEAILQPGGGRQPVPLVVEADRGRGKSAALGIAARLLRASGNRVVVTAPRPEAAQTLQRFARERADDASPVEFFAPDHLLQAWPDADLVMVDEAAALAPAVLLALLQHYPRVVLATTVQGYEGTGQGFLLRFVRQLDQLYPGWQLLRLDQPVRWQAGDPLESFIGDWLLLNACAEPVSAPAAGSGSLWQLQELTPLLPQAEESLLRAVHGLLVSAHYRTRPSDFRTLLDGPNVRTWYVQVGAQIVAVAMVAEEGGLPESLCNAIESGQRRPHGHVLAQSLAVHLSVARALRQRSWRVVRIAVHSQWQRRGVGRWLLQALEQKAQAEQVPLLGSVFSASDDVLSFWQHCGYDVVRVGIRREATSGAYPVMVVKAVDEDGMALAQQARQRFEQTFPWMLADTPDPWPAPLIVAAWQRAQFPLDMVVSAGDQQDLRHFLAGHKTYENAAVALHRQLLVWLGQGLLMSALTPPRQSLVIGRILQKQSWPTLIRQGGYSGQKQARAALREAIAELQAAAFARDCP